jgi:hypothetical protein
MKTRNETMNKKQAKKQYRPPQLKRYGTVKALTKGGHGSYADGTHLRHDSLHP